jgi:hypothetical protein
MNRFDQEPMLRAALEPVRELTPTDAEVGAALERASRTRSPAVGRGRALAIALTVLVFLSGVSYVVPATRAAIDDITGSFSSWVGGSDQEPPGRALRPEDDAPRWVREQGGRLIAENGGVGLYVSRSMSPIHGPDLAFALGEGLMTGNSLDGWRKQFDEHAIVVLGPTPLGRADLMDAHGRFPLLGVTARSVERVVLHYDSGPPLVADDVDGGFVLFVDAWRVPRDITAYDVQGRELERTGVNGIDMRYLCEREPGCPEEPSAGP